MNAKTPKTSTLQSTNVPKTGARATKLFASYFRYDKESRPTGFRYPSINQLAPSDLHVVKHRLDARGRSLGATTPVVHLVTASQIGTCDDIVLDPTSTTGNNGLLWQTMVWVVSGEGSGFIQDFLQKNYNNSTGKLVTIPKSLLSASNYTIGLTVTNALGQSGFDEVSITLLDDRTVPRLSIAGPRVINMFRYQVLSAAATASWPICADPEPFLYSWDVYEGSALVSGVESYSKDPRFYRLAPYSLEAKSTYVIQVTVAAGSSLYEYLTSAQITVVVGEYGIFASIFGGSVQSFGAKAMVIVDASASRDVDNPETHLSFVWSCTQLGNHEDGSCKNFDSLAAASSILALNSSLFLETVLQTEVLLTVVATNPAGLTASAIMTAVIMNDVVPLVSIQLSKRVFNVDDPLAITGMLFSELPVLVSWTVVDSSVSLNSIASTVQTSRTVTSAGYDVFDLGIHANSLSGGQSCTFQLEARHVGSSMSAQARVTVTINAPPTGGVVTVSPTFGVAMDTQFYLTASEWTDDISDYPFNYVFSYYAVSTADAVIVKQADNRAYAASVIGPGIENRDFEVTCVVRVYDALNSSESAVTTATVLPVTDTSLLLAKVESGLEAALQRFDLSEATQIIGAAARSLNLVNCSVPVSCSSLHRHDCSFTPRTCGPCLDGYIGSHGDSNYVCFLTSHTALPTATQCTEENARSVCESGRCRQTGVCAETDKTCPNSCTGNDGTSEGRCLFYDFNNAVTDSCPQSNPFCRAVCECNAGYYGSDCSLTKAELTVRQEIRDSLCSALYNTMNTQDVTADVVMSRALTVSHILQDVTQLTDAGIVSCAAVLVETVRDHPRIAGAESSASLYFQALSKVLQLGSKLPAALMADISTSLGLLNEGVLARMAVGQKPIEFTSSHVRMSSSLLRATDIGENWFSPPLTVYEQTQNVNVSTTSVDISKTEIDQHAAVGVMVMQYSSNHRGAATTAMSAGVSVSVFEGLTDSASGRRRLETSLPTIGVTTVLHHVADQEYAVERALVGSITCERSASPYAITVLCPATNETIVCDGKEEVRVDYNCSHWESAPQCGVWTGTEYAALSGCSVSSYTSGSTSCVCRLGHVSASHEVYESTRMVLHSFATTFLITEELTPDVVKHNGVINTVVGIFCGSALGIILGFRFDLSELAIRNEVTSDRSRNAQEKSFKELVSSWNPHELLPKTPWYTKLWVKILAKHEYISLFSDYQKIDDYRAMKVMLCIGLLVNFLFVDTLVAVLFFYNDGTCDTYKAKNVCLSLLSLDFEDPLCEWHAETEVCSFNYGIGNTFRSTLVLTAVMKVITVPFQIFYISMVDALRDVYCVLFIQNKTVKAIDDGFKMDFEKFQTKRGKMMRAARLAKMRELMDDCTVEEEAKILKDQIQHDLTKPLHPMYDIADVQILIQKNQFSKRRQRASIQTNLQNSNRRASFMGRVIQNQSKKTPVGLDNPNVQQQNVTVSNLFSHNFTNNESLEQLEKKVEAARKQEAEIMELLEHATTTQGRNRILMNHFCATLLPGFRHSIGMKVFRYTAREASFGLKLGRYHYFSLVVFPCYIIGTCFYVYLFGVRIGGHNTISWLQGNLVSLAQDLFLILPFRLYIKWIAMSSIIVQDVNIIYDHLRDKAKLLTMRSRGLMKNANAKIHHLNPACRAARKYPGLAISRLLMSITDDDLPHGMVRSNKISLSSISEAITVTTILSIASWPEVIQDVMYEASAICGIGGVLIILVVFVKISMAIPVFLGTFFLGTPFLYILWNERRLAREAAAEAEKLAAANEAAEALAAREAAEIMAMYDLESQSEERTSTPEPKGPKGPPAQVVAMEWQSLLTKWNSQPLRSSDRDSARSLAPTDQDLSSHNSDIPAVHRPTLRPRPGPAPLGQAAVVPIAKTKRKAEISLDSVPEAPPGQATFQFGNGGYNYARVCVEYDSYSSSSARSPPTAKSAGASESAPFNLVDSFKLMAGLPSLGGTISTKESNSSLGSSPIKPFTPPDSQTSGQRSMEMIHSNMSKVDDTFPVVRTAARHSTSKQNKSISAQDGGADSANPASQHFKPLSLSVGLPTSTQLGTFSPQAPKSLSSQLASPRSDDIPKADVPNKSSSAPRTSVVDSAALMEEFSSSLGLSPASPHGDQYVPVRVVGDRASSVSVRTGQRLENVLDSEGATRHKHHHRHKKDPEPTNAPVQPFKPLSLASTVSSMPEVSTFLSQLEQQSKPMSVASGSVDPSKSSLLPLVSAPASSLSSAQSSSANASSTSKSSTSTTSVPVVTIQLSSLVTVSPLESAKSSSQAAASIMDPVIESEATMSVQPKLGGQSQSSARAPVSSMFGMPYPVMKQQPAPEATVNQNTADASERPTSKSSAISIPSEFSIPNPMAAQQPMETPMPSLRFESPAYKVEATSQLQSATAASSSLSSMFSLPYPVASTSTVNVPLVVSGRSDSGTEHFSYNAQNRMASLSSVAEMPSHTEQQPLQTQRQASIGFASESDAGAAGSAQPVVSAAPVVAHPFTPPGRSSFSDTSSYEQASLARRSQSLATGDITSSSSVRLQQSASTDISAPAAHDPVPKGEYSNRELNLSILASPISAISSLLSPQTPVQYSETKFGASHTTKASQDFPDAASVIAAAERRAASIAVLPQPYVYTQQPELQVARGEYEMPESWHRNVQSTKAPVQDTVVSPVMSAPSPSQYGSSTNNISIYDDPPWTPPAPPANLASSNNWNTPVASESSQPVVSSALPRSSVKARFKASPRRTPPRTPAAELYRISIVRTGSTSKVVISSSKGLDDPEEASDLDEEDEAPTDGETCDPVELEAEYRLSDWVQLLKASKQ
jgi:hypothetical protein